MSKPTNKLSTRITIDLTPEFYERLEQLEAKTYLGTKAAVVRHALAIYGCLAGVAENGGSVIIRTLEGEERYIDNLALALRRK